MVPGSDAGQETSEVTGDGLWAAHRPLFSVLLSISIVAILFYNQEKVEDDGSSQLAWETQSRAAASLRCPQRLCKGHRTLKDPPTKCSGVGLLPPGPAPPGNTEARPGGGRRGSRRVDLPQGRGHPTSRPF